jgi:stearoyl-CoA desaturase (delta-9 desaturase)
MNKKIQLFILQLICHVFLVWAIFNFTLVDWACTFFVYFLTGCLGGTVTYHRYYSHKSFKFKYDWVRKFFVLCACWGVSGDPIAWVNNHRQHHRLTDKPGDPHSPTVFGFVKVQWFSMFHSYTNLRFVPDMIRDKFLVFIHEHYYKMHWLILVSFCLIDIKLAAVFYLVPAAVVWNMGSFTNTINHALGYRNHETKDLSTNFLPLGYLVWGEGWHNNHHNMPSAKRFGERWWEFDMGYQVIKLVEE